MQPLHDLAQTILQILSHPAWQGMGVIVTTLLSLAATIHARRSQTPQRRLPARNSKKNQAAQPAVSNSSTRVLKKDGTHRSLLLKDLDVIDPTNLNRLVSPILKK